MAKDKEILVKVKVQEEGTGSKKVSEGLDGIKKSAGGVKETMSNLPGPIGKAVTAVKGFGLAFKTALGPITLILAAITGLVKAFTSTKEGGEKVKQLMAALGATVDVLRDRALKLISAFKNLFSGNFKKAGEDFKKVTQDITKEIREEARAAAELTKEIQAITDAQRNLNVERAQQNRDLAEAKLLINDETAAYEDRLSALDQVAAAEVALLEKEIDLNNDLLTAQQALADQSYSDEETFNRLAELQIIAANLAEQSFNKQKEIADQRRTLLAKQVAEEKAKNDAILADNKKTNDEIEKETKRSNEVKKKLEEDYKKVFEKVTSDIEELRKGNILAEIEDWEERQRQRIYFIDEEQRAKKEAEVKSANESVEGLVDEYARKVELALLYNQWLTEQNLKLKTDLENIEIEADKRNTDRVISKLDQELDMQKEKFFLLEENELTRALVIEALRDREDQNFLLANHATNEEFQKQEEQHEARVTAIKLRHYTERSALVANIAADGFGVLASLAEASAGQSEASQEKAFNLAKAAGIAQATMNTYASAVASYNALAGIPIVGPALGAAAAAVAVAAGVVNIKKIKETTFDKANGSPPAGSSPSGKPSGTASSLIGPLGGATQIGPASNSKFEQGGLRRGNRHAQGGIGFNGDMYEGGEFIMNRNTTNAFLPLLDRLNDLGKGDQRSSGNVSGATESIGIGGNQIIKTYVVSSDMTSEQEADKKISDIARL